MFVKKLRASHGVWALLVLTLAVYSPIFQAGFVYDDHPYVRDNPGIRQLNPWAIFSDPSLGAAPTTHLAQDAYRPAVTLSYALDYALWGNSPQGYHLENILWALLNAVLAWFFLKRVLNSTPACLIALAFFLWHPVQVQAIAWISQRSTLLASTGMLLTLLCLGPSGPWSLKRLFGGWFAFALALFCRETAGGVLLSLGLLDAFHASTPSVYARNRWRFWARYLSLVLLILAYILLRSQLLPRWSHFTGPRQWGSDLALGMMAFALYLGKLICPVALRLHYAYPAPELHAVLWSGFVTVLFFALLLWAFYRRFPWAVPVAWVFIFLIPVLQVLPIRAFAAERYLYFSLLGFAWGIGLLYQRFQPLRPALWTLAGVALFLSARQVPLWVSEEKLWEAAVRADPQDAYAHVAYAGQVQDLAVAERHLRWGLQNNPPLPIRIGVLSSLSWVALQRREWKAAKAWAEEALRVAPNDQLAQINLQRAVAGMRQRPVSSPHENLEK